MQKTSVLRFHTSGNRDPYRQGYRYRMSVPGPIQPISEQKPALVNRAKQVVSALTGFGRG